MNVCGFEFPEDVWVHPDHDVWVRVEPDGVAVVGITSLGVRLSGEVYMCRPKPVGSEIEAGRSIAVVELAKAIVSVKSPIAGRVLAGNEALRDHPESIHRDPYGSGWIVRMAAADFEADRSALVRGEVLAGIVAERVRLERLDDA